MPVHHAAGKRIAALDAEVAALEEEGARLAAEIDELTGEMAPGIA